MYAQIPSRAIDGQNGGVKRNDLLQGCRATARQGATAYHNLVVGEFNARPQVGTTPGNPELVTQWNEGQVELNKVGESISSLNTLSNETSSTSALAAVLSESTRVTFGLRGASAQNNEVHVYVR